MLSTTLKVCGVVLPFVVIVSVIVYSISWTEIPADQPGVANLTGSRVTPTLQFVVIVSRHGNRSPLSIYDSALPYPANDSSVWPYGLGQLTKRGRIQMYNLGKKIRSLYNGFLAETYSAEPFKAHSTDVDRVLESAELAMAGLFPPIGFQVWKNELSWQPVPVHIDNLPNIKDINPAIHCQRFDEEQSEFIAQFNQQNENSMAALYKYLHNATGYTVAPGFDLHHMLANLWDSLFSAANEGLPLPRWASPIYPEPTRTMWTKFLKAFLVSSTTMIRLLQGPFFQEIVNLIEAKGNGTLSPSRRMHYYSAHDTTIVGLRTILGATFNIVSPSSALIFEVHQHSQTEEYQIQVLYLDGGSPDSEPTTVNIPGCGELCQFHQLLNMTEKYYNITDYVKECNASK